LELAVPQTPVLICLHARRCPLRGEEGYEWRRCNIVAHRTHTHTSNDSIGKRAALPKVAPHASACGYFRSGLVCLLHVAGVRACEGLRRLPTADAKSDRAHNHSVAHPCTCLIHQRSLLEAPVDIMFKSTRVQRANVHRGKNRWMEHVGGLYVSMYTCTRTTNRLASLRRAAHGKLPQEGSAAPSRATCEHLRIRQTWARVFASCCLTFVMLRFRHASQ